MQCKLKYLQLSFSDTGISEMSAAIPIPPKPRGHMMEEKSEWKGTGF